MPSKAPTLPAKGKKAAPTNHKDLPILQAQYVTLEDGTQVNLKDDTG